MTAATFDSREWTDDPAGQAGRVTVRTVLFGQDPREVVPRGGWAELRQAVSRIRKELHPVVERELALAVAGLLDVELRDTLVHGWRAHTKLQEAARATMDSPGTAEVVGLVTHRVTANHEPHVDLIVDGAILATVKVTIEVTIDVDGLLATVRGGRLMAIHSGHCKVGVVLRYAGSELASGTAELQAPAVVTLDDGIDLLSVGDRQRYGDPRDDAVRSR